MNKLIEVAGIVLSLILVIIIGIMIGTIITDEYTHRKRDCYKQGIGEYYYIKGNKYEYTKWICPDAKE